MASNKKTQPRKTSAFTDEVIRYILGALKFDKEVIESIKISLSGNKFIKVKQLISTGNLDIIRFLKFSVKNVGDFQIIFVSGSNEFAYIISVDMSCKDPTLAALREALAALDKISKNPNTAASPEIASTVLCSEFLRRVFRSLLVNTSNIESILGSNEDLKYLVENCKTKSK